LTRPIPAQEKLLPEQQRLLDRLTEQRLAEQQEPWHVLRVQGVAGSGKTTVALAALRSIVKAHTSLLEDQQLTPVYISQSPRLVEECRNRLSMEGPPVTTFLSPLGEIVPKRLNFIPASAFLSLASAATDQATPRTLTDEECISIVREITAARGLGTQLGLLPSQTYAIITSFLKGRRRLRQMTTPEVRELISSEDVLRFGGYSRYIPAVREFVLSDYQEKLDRKNTRDRADVAASLLNSLSLNELHYDEVVKWSRDYVDARSAHSLLDQLPDHRKWLLRLFEHVPVSRQALDAPIAQTARSLLPLFDKKKIARDEWPLIQDCTRRIASRFGQVGTDVGSGLAKHIPNPLIVVDEVQDFSEVELLAIMSLFFHLPRTRSSRLVFLGDANQQVLPSGFSWEQTFEHLAVQARRYQYHDYFDFNPNFEDAESADAYSCRPYLFLKNNYRTTPEIADLAFHLAASVAKQVFPADRTNLQRKYVERLVNKGTTLPNDEEVERMVYAFMERNVSMNPQIVVCPRETVFSAVKRWLASSTGTLVVLTEDPLAFETSLGQAAQSSQLLCMTCLGCKGLEFPEEIIVGLPRKRSDAQDDLPDYDLLAQWYTAVTRAQVRLTLFLEPTEFEYLKRCGFSDQEILASGVEVSFRDSSPTSVDWCVGLLSTESRALDAEARLRDAERQLADFLRFPKHAWRLKRAIDTYTELARFANVQDAWRTASAAYEAESMYQEARDCLDNIDDRGLRETAKARCFRLETEAVARRGDSQVARGLIERATRFAEEVDASRSPNTVAVWAELGEHARAVECAMSRQDLLSAEQHIGKVKDEAARRDLVIRLASLFRARGNEGRWLAIRTLYSNGFSTVAQDQLLELRQAAARDRVAAGYLIRALAWGSRQDRAGFARQLEEQANQLLNRSEFELAALALEALGVDHLAADNWLKAYERFNDDATTVLSPALGRGDDPALLYFDGLRAWVNRWKGQLASIEPALNAPLADVSAMASHKEFARRGRPLLEPLESALGLFAQRLFDPTLFKACVRERAEVVTAAESQERGRGLGDLLRSAVEQEVRATTIQSARAAARAIADEYERRVMECARRVLTRDPARACQIESHLHKARRLRRAAAEHKTDLSELRGGEMIRRWSSGRLTDMEIAAECWTADAAFRGHLDDRLESLSVGKIRRERRGETWEDLEMSPDDWAGLVLRLFERRYEGQDLERMRALVRRLLEEAPRTDPSKAQQLKDALAKYFPAGGGPSSGAGVTGQDLSPLVRAVGELVAAVRGTGLDPAIRVAEGIALNAEVGESFVVLLAKLEGLLGNSAPEALRFVEALKVHLPSAAGKSTRRRRR
jgi:hypothetical protein